MGRPKGAKEGSCIWKNCLFCKQDFSGHSKVTKFCSLRCRSQYKSEIFALEKLCIICGTKFKLTKHKENKTCGIICRKKNLSNVKKGQIGYWKGKKRPDMYWFSKENHHLWKGGVTPINNIIRKSVKFKEWREAVFKRDDYTCQECLIRGGKLHPDHIKPFGLFPELRFELSNGRTLCADCHRKTPTWGVNSNYFKREDFTSGAYLKFL